MNVKSRGSRSRFLQQTEKTEERLRRNGRPDLPFKKGLVLQALRQLFRGRQGLGCQICMSRIRRKPRGRARVGIVAQTARPWRDSRTRGCTGPRENCTVSRDNESVGRGRFCQSIQAREKNSAGGMATVTLSVHVVAKRVPSQMRSTTAVNIRRLAEDASCTEPAFSLGAKCRRIVANTWSETRFKSEVEEWRISEANVTASVPYPRHGSVASPMRNL